MQREGSMLTFETNQVQGRDAIIQKLVVSMIVPFPKPPSDTKHSWQDLPFSSTQHKIATSDAQPSSDAGGILVMVTGQLVVRLDPPELFGSSLISV